MLKFHSPFPLSRIPNKNPAKFRRSNLSVPRLKPSFARLLAFSSSSRSKNERTEPEQTKRRAKETSVALLRNETSEIYQLDNFSTGIDNRRSLQAVAIVTTRYYSTSTRSFLIDPRRTWARAIHGIFRGRDSLESPGSNNGSIVLAIHILLGVSSFYSQLSDKNTFFKL